MSLFLFSFFLTLIGQERSRGQVIFKLLSNIYYHSRKKNMYNYFTISFVYCHIVISLTVVSLNVKRIISIFHLNTPYSFQYFISAIVLCKKLKTENKKQTKKKNKKKKQQQMRYLHCFGKMNTPIKCECLVYVC